MSPVSVSDSGRTGASIIDLEWVNSSRVLGVGE